MPHIKRTPVECTPLPPAELLADSDAPVFYIDYTGEVFLNYDDYFARISLYRKKIWSCEFTGKNNLTFSEAVDSERKSKQRVEERFPRVWNQPALALIHFNQAALNELIDELYELFKANFFVGETVFISTTIDKAVSERATIISVLPDLTQSSHTKPNVEEYDKPIVLKKESFADTDSIATSAAISATTESLIPTQESDAADLAYRSQFKDPRTGVIPDIVDIVPGEKAYYLLVSSTPQKTAAVSVSHFRRDRLALSKQTFKKYIREVAIKDKWIGAPWVVRPELVQKFKLRTTPPKELQHALDRRNTKGDSKVVYMGKQDLKHKSLREVAVSLPIDDLELYRYRLFRQPAEDNTKLPVRPAPSYDFGTIPSSHVLQLITVWNFTSAYGPYLHLYPFTFDAFLQAISTTNTQNTPPLLEELFSSLIHLVCEEWCKGIDPNTGIHPAVKPFPVLSEEFMTPNATVSLSSTNALMTSTIIAYQALNPDERIAIDQWFKWQPGNWSTSIPTKRQRTTPVRSAHTPSYSSSAEKSTDRLKAWEVALAGIIKDCMHSDTEEIEALKWRTLSLLLTTKPSTSKLDRSDVGINGHSLSDPLGDVADSVVTDPNDVANDNTSVVESTDDVKQNGASSVETNGNLEDVEDDTLDDTLDDIVSYPDMESLNDTYVDEGGSGDDISHRVRNGGSSDYRKHRKIYESDEEDWTPDGRPVSATRKGRHTRQTKSKKVHAERSSPSRLAASGRHPRTSSGLHHSPSSVSTPPKPITNGSAKKSKNKRKSKASSVVETDTTAFEELCCASRCGFGTLSAADKIAILAYLIDVCLVDCELLRQCRDKAIDEAIELRKEKRDIVRDRKAVAQSILELGFLAGETSVALTSESTAKLDDADDLESEHSGSDTEKSSRQLSRVQKLRAEQLRRDNEEKRRQDEIQRQKEQSKELKAKQDGRRKLEDKDRQLHCRQRIIDHLLRIQYAIVRIKPLGRDRYHNRYWWFDGGYGAYPFFTVTQGVETSKGSADSEAGVLDFASGCLFVEEFGVENMIDDKWIKHWNETRAESEDLKSARPSEGGVMLDARLGLLNGKWGYYSTPEQIDQLLAWLDPRGIRELHLSSNISHLSDFITESMLKRSETLATAISLEVNGSGRHMRPEYENIWAQE
ncbi:hypothetical protein O5D80_008352 [Batrachochytrium dendrobatidis]|nr:hypothetical protein O5D80_008352 [Batrachochytrium dendrobatidis]